MKQTILFLTIMVSLTAVGQTDSIQHREKIMNYQIEMNDHFKSDDSPLTEEDKGEFRELDFFTINKKFRVIASFERTPDAEPFVMLTSKERKEPPMYVKYGYLYFSIDGKDFKLEAYQNLKYKDHEEYGKELFIPFSDLTNGFDSYGGGRFLDILIPESDEIILDFNKAYNPYCAYNHKYSCPIPTKANHLELKIEAGVKAFVSHEDEER